MRAVHAVVVMAVLLLPEIVLGADRSADELSVEAQQECHAGREAQERAVRLHHFKKSQRLAEQAVKLNDHLANAHFALFCSLGEQMRIDGEMFSTASALGFRRMMRALDRTLALDPGHLDALSSKGTFLVRLPALLGGNFTKGEAMLRAVIQRAPNAINARLTLARSYAERGHRDEAIELAETAFRIAEGERRVDLLPEARALLTELRSLAH